MPKPPKQRTRKKNHYEEPPKIGDGTFGYKGGNIEFYVPSKYLDAYLAADYWKDFNLTLYNPVFTSNAILPTIKDKL